MASYFGQIGDIVTIAGIYADGTTARDGGPYLEKPLKKWRLGETVGTDGIRATRLIPLNDDGSVDEFNNACGNYTVKVPI